MCDKMEMEKNKIRIGNTESAAVFLKQPRTDRQNPKVYLNLLGDENVSGKMCQESRAIILPALLRYLCPGRISHGNFHRRHDGHLVC